MTLARCLSILLLAGLVGCASSLCTIGKADWVINAEGQLAPINDPHQLQTLEQACVDIRRQDAWWKPKVAAPAYSIQHFVIHWQDGGRDVLMPLGDLVTLDDGPLVAMPPALQQLIDDFLDQYPSSPTTQTVQV